MGADEVILTKVDGWAAKHASTSDFILDCVSAPHDVAPYLSLLKRGHYAWFRWHPETPIAVPAFAVAIKRKSLAGSAIGGIKETQEMLDFCGKHNIVSDALVVYLASHTRTAEGSSRDLLMLVGATTLLSIAASIAAAGPARRASTVDPLTALRYE